MVLLFSFPPGRRSSSGIFGRGIKNVLISSSNFANSSSSFATSLMISLTCAKIALTSPPAFLTCGTDADNLFLSAFAASTLSNNCLRRSTMFKNGVKST